MIHVTALESMVSQLNDLGENVSDQDVMTKTPSDMKKSPSGGATSGCTSSQSLLLVTVFKVFLHLSLLCFCGLD
jgi:hypothetical protein